MSDGPSTEAVIGLSIATAVPGVWSFFCPPVLDQSPYGDELVKQQQIKATVASLALGATAGMIARKPWPFLVAMFICGLMVWEYGTARKRDTVQ